MDIRRPRLIRRLSVAARHPVTVIAAPAGYGKTVLVDQWAAEHDGPPLVRVDIRAEGNWPRTAARISAGLPPGDEAIVVMDGVDESSDERLAHELPELLERAPASLHFIFVSRSRAVPVLDGLHGRTDVAFLTAADLAFTSAEARTLIRNVASLKLTDEQLARLQARTEGLPAGLALAAMGLRDAPDPESYIETYGGDERHVAAFFLDEVLAEQPPAIRRFLARTSILEQLNGALSDAVTAEQDGAVVLRSLERSGIPIARCPDSREWFAYHGLFRDVLRWELRRGEYGEEAALHVRAGEWYAANDDPVAAARHFVEAEDWDRVIGLADEVGQHLYENGQAGEALSWLDALPATHPRHTSVALRRAYLHTLIGEPQQAAQVVHDLEVSGVTRGERVATDALRTLWTFFDSTPESTIKTADTVLQALQTVELRELPDLFGMTSPASLVMITGSARARALWHLGDVAGARRGLTAVVKRTDVYTPWLLRTLSALALLEAWAGNLRVARVYAIRATAVARRRGLLQHPAMVDTFLALAHVSRERGNQARAARFLDEFELIGATGRRVVTAAIVAVERARWHLANGQPEEGLAVLERYRAGRESSAPPLIEAQVSAAEASLLVALGDIEGAESLIASSAGAPFCADLAAAGVQAAVALRDPVEAAARLERWIVDDAQPRQRLRRDLWSAVVEFEFGDRRRAIPIMSAVVSGAEREGDVRMFLDGGRPVERLLRALVHAAPLPYAELLVRTARLSEDPGKGTVLGLSKRELEVARYLPTPLSSAEIAERLYISLNTLKTHLRTIYGKLDATNRREAIQRAEELGIA